VRGFRGLAASDIVDWCESFSAGPGVVLGRVPANMVPGRTRTHEDVLFDDDSRIAIDAAERDAPDLARQTRRQRRAGSEAEANTPAVAGLEVPKAGRAGSPTKSARLHLRVRRARAAEYFSAARTVAAPRVPQRHSDRIGNSPAATSTGQHGAGAQTRIHRRLGSATLKFDLTLHTVAKSQL
jgi:hypothetical protein